MRLDSGVDDSIWERHSVQFGVVLPNMGSVVRPDDLSRLAQRVEGLAYDSLWVSDHVVLPLNIESRYPYSSRGVFPFLPQEDILEPVTTLTFLAGATRHIRLGISALILPYRHPVLNTKMLTTLDVLSGGRTILGVGVGWMKEEFEVLDADYEHRGRITDEHIRIFKALCTQQEPSFEGEDYRVKGIAFSPKPLQKPHPPIWVGGNTGPAMRRAAFLGDGWHAVNLRPAQLAAGRQEVFRLRRQHGLETDRFQVSLRTSLQVTAEPLGEDRTPLTGTSRQIEEDIRRYEEAGAEYLVMGPRGANIDDVLSTIERFAEGVMAKL